MQRLMLIAVVALVAAAAFPVVDAQNLLSLVGGQLGVQAPSMRTVTSTSQTNLGGSYCCGVSGLLLRNYNQFCIPDEEDPVVTCPGDITLDNPLSAASLTTSWGAFEASDDQCGIKHSECSHEREVSVFYPGDNRVTCTATDGSGRSTSCDFNVHIQNCELYSTDSRIVEGGDYPIDYRTDTVNANTGIITAVNPSANNWGISPPLSIRGCSGLDVCSWAVMFANTAINAAPFTQLPHWIIYDIPITETDLLKGAGSGTIPFFKKLGGSTSQIHQTQLSPGNEHNTVRPGANDNFWGYLAPYSNPAPGRGTSVPYRFTLFTFRNCPTGVGTAVGGLTTLLFRRTLFNLVGGVEVPTNNFVANGQTLGGKYEINVNVRY